MTTVVDAEAVQVHQTDPPPSSGPPGKEPLVSALSSVAPASVPVKVMDEPVRAVRLVKLSFTGAWPSAPAADSSVATAKQPNCCVLIFLESICSVRSSNPGARKREQRPSTNGEDGCKNGTMEAGGSQIQSRK